MAFTRQDPSTGSLVSALRAREPLLRDSACFSDVSGLTTCGCRHGLHSQHRSGSLQPWLGNL